MGQVGVVARSGVVGWAATLAPSSQTFARLMSRWRNSPDVEHPERDPATVAGRCAVLAGDRPGPRVLSARQSGPSAMPGQWLGGREDGHAVAGGSSYDGWHVWGGRLGQLAGGRGLADGREEL